MVYICCVVTTNMEELQTYHHILLRNLKSRKQRFLYPDIDWSLKMIALKGARGTGKTTLMLQRIREMKVHDTNALYITMEHPHFYSRSLFDVAQEFYTLGGRHLFIDEVHKYERWSNELKVIYDGFPDLKVVFSASSALDIYRGQSDLSRRVDVYELPGLSFREYLAFHHNSDFSSYPLDQLLNSGEDIVSDISKRMVIIPHFKKYLEWGYYPFHLESTSDQYQPRLLRVINTVIDSDLAYIDGYHIEASIKVKRLLGVLAESVPFRPNISSLSRKTEVSRDLIYTYLTHLEKAHLLQLLHRSGKGVSRLQKPDKIYLDNTNLAYALQANPDRGTLRETFAMNQLVSAGYRVSEPKSGDFYVEDYDVILEIGGRNKTADQIAKIDNGYLVKDDIDVAFGKTLPLWLLGFLY